MNKLTEVVIENIPRDIFTDFDLINLIGGSNDKRYGLVKRACANGGIVRVKKGLYCLPSKYQRHKINLYQLAQYIYGPSYVSMESALSYHGWIPEAVHTLTSACVKKSRNFMTPLGAFSFRRVPTAVFYSAVDRITPENGEAFFMATPLKALADYVYIHKENWEGLAPVVESLRVEPDCLKEAGQEGFDRLYKNYNSRRVKKFIKGLKKDLRP